MSKTQEQFSTYLLQSVQSSAHPIFDELAANGTASVRLEPN
ncbi:MAG: hypothetical protein ACXW0L_08300 [Methylosarcina sp.]